MTFPSDLTSLSPEERCNYGFARVRDIAFDSVQALWRIRKIAGVTQSQLAAAIGKDEAWVSRNLRGPGNWTLRTLGAFIEALDGEIEITITPHEDIKRGQMRPKSAHPADRYRWGNRSHSLRVLGQALQPGPH